METLLNFRLIINRTLCSSYPFPSFIIVRIRWPEVQLCTIDFSFSRKWIKRFPCDFAFVLRNFHHYREFPGYIPHTRPVKGKGDFRGLEDMIF